jgi:hypothetical protein
MQIHSLIQAFQADACVLTQQNSMATVSKGEKKDFHASAYSSIGSSVQCSIVYMKYEKKDKIKERLD